MRKLDHAAAYLTGVVHPGTDNKLRRTSRQTKLRGCVTKISLRQKSYLRAERCTLWTESIGNPHM